MTLTAGQLSFPSPLPDKVYTASGSYTITVSVQDADGDYYAATTQTLTVLAAPPQLAVAGSQTAVVGQDLVIPNLASYVGSLDPSGDNSLDYSIDWGDGTDPDTGVIGAPGCAAPSRERSPAATSTPPAASTPSPCKWPGPAAAWPRERSASRPATLRFRLRTWR